MNSSYLKELIVRNGMTWFDAHHTVSPEGEASYEWYFRDRCLAIFVQDETVQLLKIWGHRIHEDMEEIMDPTDAQLVASWKWLHNHG